MSWFETPQGERIELFGSGGGARAADAFGVPLLGQVPRQLEITKGGDAGAPITAAQPDSPAAQTYHEIAGGVARRVATIAMQNGNDFAEGRALKTMDDLKAEVGASH
jgi:ATP-binding protein involved in chromosome partitioning